MSSAGVGSRSRRIEDQPWSSAAVTAVALALVLTVGAAASPALAQPPAGILPGSGPVTLEGELEVLYEDDERTGRLLHFLHSGNRRIPLLFRRGAEPDLPTGSRVRVSGTLADGSVTTTSVSTMSVPESRTFGHQPVLVILFNFSNDTAQPYTPGSIAGVNDSVTNFYVENSYGQTFMSFTTAGWFTIAARNDTCDYYTWATQAEAMAQNAGYDLSAYTRRILAFPQVSACNWWGMGYLGGNRSWVNGRYALRVVAHELGHNFGNHHSMARWCDSASCTEVEYGDDRDVLGASGVVGHLNAFQKERLGWLNYGGSPAVQTVTSSNDYWIHSYETTGSEPKALRIWNPNTSTYYYVESRARIGFDGSVSPGVVLHSGSPTITRSSHQLDMAPLTSTYDSTLDPGQTFADTALGLHITTLTTGPEGALIRVEFGTRECVAATPSVSLSPASEAGAPGTPVRYTVSVTNNNSGGCPPSAFAVSAVLPAGWTQSVSGTGVSSLPPGSTGTMTLTVTPAEPVGTYGFDVRATDTLGGFFGVTRAALTVATTLAVESSATAAGSRGNRSVTVRARVVAGGAPLAGASLTVTLRDPSGRIMGTASVTTASDGTASARFSLKSKDPSGPYAVQSAAAKNGMTGTSTTSVNVP